MFYKITKISCLLLFFISTSIFAKNEQIQKVRVWSSATNTRVVFDISNNIKYDALILENPKRLVLDFKNTDLSTDLSTLNFNSSTVVGIRAAKQNNDLRVVVDVSKDNNVQHFYLAPSEQQGHRVVVDVMLPGVSVKKPNTETANIEETTSQIPKSTTNNNTSLQRDRNTIVVIDAGHGGKDPGAISTNKLYQEKQVVLKIAKKLYDKINATPGFTAFLTRNSDFFIPLRERTKIARNKKADLFISIHADAAPNKNASGASVYVLSEKSASSETAKWLANKENQSDLIGGLGSIDLSDKDEVLAGILIDLSMTATIDTSKKIGKTILSNLGSFIKLHKQNVEQAGFMVLKSPDIPALLIETGFISNQNEAKLLNDELHQNRIVNAITKGVNDYFNRYPLPGTMLFAKSNNKNITHLVKKGESLSQIARMYNTDINKIKEINNLVGNAIKIDQTIIIPNS